MGLKKKLLAITLLALLVAACAGFNYKYYGLDIPSYEGTLLGPKPKYDRPFKECQPLGEHQKGMCVVMFVDEFEKMRIDMIDTKERLKACESSHP